MNSAVKCLVGTLVGVAWLSAAAAADDKPLSAAVQAGADKGFTACAGKLDELVKFAHKNDSAYGHVDIAAPDKADDRTYTTITSQGFSGSNMVGTFSGVKTADGRCDVTMTQVFPVVDSTCLELRDKTFRDWRYVRDVGGVPLYELPSDGVATLILVPLKTAGCLAVKTYIRYYADR